MRCECCNKKINKKLEEYYVGFAHKGYLCDYCFHHCHRSLIDGIWRWECEI
jgi:hypothetical protein